MPNEQEVQNEEMVESPQESEESEDSLATVSADITEEVKHAAKVDVQNLTPAEINQAVADLAGVDVESKLTALGVTLFHNGNHWNPVEFKHQADFAASRCGCVAAPGEAPRDICLGLLARKK